MRKPGIPPARIPEITKSSLHGITLYPVTLKQTPTKPDRNESGEKNYRVKQESETWSKVKMTGISLKVVVDNSFLACFCARRSGQTAAS